MLYILLSILIIAILLFIASIGCMSGGGYTPKKGKLPPPPKNFRPAGESKNGK